MDSKARQIILLERPIGIPSESSFGFEKCVVPTQLLDQEVRLHGLYYSVDPYMRVRMNERGNYVAPFALNKPMEGNVVARVLESKSLDISAGDLVFGLLPWATDMVISSKKVKRLNIQNALASDYLGVLGLTGLTAYFGLLRIGQPSAGDTVIISGAAGAVGGVAGQIAKIKGCKVVGIVGSDAKADLIRNRFKFDVAINYKTSKNLRAEIQAACPNGADVYFDNVGGSVSDAVLKNMKVHGRVAICGQISLYNLREVPKGPEVEPLLLARDINMEGFSVTDFQSEFPEAMEQLSKWLNQGKIESSETIVDGFDNLPKALIGLFSGKNTGKMIVKAAA